MLAEEFDFTQSAIIPYRLEEGKLEILLITSIRKKKWIIPKGFIEFNLSAFESAKKEAFEEAGVIGTNETIELGSFTIKKYGGRTNIVVYSMEVEKFKDDYPEKNLRKRKWYSVEEAIETISIPEVIKMIETLAVEIKASQS
ncbi:MAG: NUDIX hydrolase [Ignavibacteria bacterium]|nr:MAG: NUDIX hydrolase [Ignavibacteria bacterium]